MTIRSICLSDFKDFRWLSFWAVGSLGVGCSAFEVSEGKVPLPSSNQYKSTSGNVFVNLSTNSKLGLFLPESKWEILERCTLILSANTEADIP